MRTFNLTLLSVFGYVAVIGASPLGARAPAESLDRRDPPYCNEYPEGTGCSTSCRFNPLQQRCRDLCEKARFSFCPGALPPFCIGGLPCGGIDSPHFPYYCVDDPLQPTCVDICVKNPNFKLPFCTGVPGPAAKAVDRRQYPDCDQYPDAPGCGLDICDVYPELCGPSNSD